jgi:hypothetical protein
LSELGVQDLEYPFEKIIDLLEDSKKQVKSKVAV